MRVEDRLRPANGYLVLAVLSCLFLAGVALAQVGSQDNDAADTEFKVVNGVKTKNIDGFGGVIAESYDDSKEWWPPYVTPNKDAPNVIIFLLDDVGFAQVGSFGGLIETPNIDRLAANGLRFNNFHTTALCSPSRASLMAGRNPHSIGLGSHSLTAMGFPGYKAIMPDSAKSVANYGLAGRAVRSVAQRRGLRAFLCVHGGGCAPVYSGDVE